MAPTQVLAGAQVVLPTGTVTDGRVIVEGTRIAGSAPGDAATVDLSGHWLVPGFVDLHNHGGGGGPLGAGAAAPPPAPAPPPPPRPPAPGAPP
ncbi:hypothetical protein AB0O78_30045, partial [Streptomyces griseoviridis]